MVLVTQNNQFSVSGTQIDCTAPFYVCTVNIKHGYTNFIHRTATDRKLAKEKD